jgi:hypothetical protein
MRQLVLAAGAVCAAAGLAVVGLAQDQPNVMPGQVVGTGFTVGGVGKQIPKAAPRAGQPINVPADSEMMRKYDPSRPLDAFKGTNLNPNLVAAPIPSIGDQSLFDKLTAKLKSVVGMATPTPVNQRPTYFPSLSRRNKERAEERMWRRD